MKAPHQASKECRNWVRTGFLTSLTSLSLIGVFGPSLVAEPDHDWPRWRGTQFNDSSPATGIFDGSIQLEIAWKKEIGSGYSGISAVGETIVTLASTGEFDEVIALDATSGEQVWSHAIAPTFPGRDGAEDGPCGTPTIDVTAGPNGIVYAVGPFGHFLALDLKTGEERWSTHLANDHGGREPHWGFTSAPLVVGDIVMVQNGGSDDNAFTAFDRLTGEVRWVAGDDNVDYQSPTLITLGGEQLILGVGEYSLYGLRPETGEEVFDLPHGASGFYAKIVNPLMIDEGLFLIEQAGNQSKLVLIEEYEGEIDIEGQWLTRDIKRNYNQSVVHEGYIYGHSGPILTCIDADSGARVWRSRPPGDGYMFLADGHLVHLTKSGLLTIIAANSSGYDQIAQIEVSEHQGWTPPILSNGRIYARDSFSQIACIDVVHSDIDTSTIADSGPRIGDLIPDLIERLDEAGSEGDKASVIDTFLDAQESFPIVEEGNIAHFVYRGDADEVVIVGDMLEDGESAIMERMSDTDLFVRSFELRPDARVGYLFVSDIDQQIIDPRNRATTIGLNRAQQSELIMPGRAIPTASTEGVDDGSFAGTTESFSLRTPIVPVGGLTWGGDRDITVYLPAGYEQSDRRYPVVYVNDASPATQFLGVPELLDGICAQTSEPVIAVMVQSTSGYELARSQRGHYRDFMCEEIVAYVDEHYRTQSAPSSRAIFGMEEGAYGALYIGLSRPDVFGYIAAQSIYLGSMQGREELNDLANTSDTLPTVCLNWGAYDSRSTRLGKHTQRYSTALAETLRNAGATVLGGERNDGATYGCWRERFHEVIEGFAPLSVR